MRLLAALFFLLPLQALAAPHGVALLDGTGAVAALIVADPLADVPPAGFTFQEEPGGPVIVWMVTPDTATELDVNGDPVPGPTGSPMQVETGTSSCKQVEAIPQAGWTYSAGTWLPPGGNCTP